MFDIVSPRFSFLEVGRFCLILFGGCKTCDVVVYRELADIIGISARDSCLTLTFITVIWGRF